MAQTGDSRPPYPPQDGHAQNGYYGQQQSPQQRPPTREDNSHYSAPPASEPPRQGQYPAPPAQHAPYPPPGQWPGQQPAAYPPPAHHYPDPQHGAYQYGPPRPDMSQPPQPMQPDAYRLPPPPPNPHYPYGGYYPAPQQQHAPRQRTAIACKYCRKRKIRCSGYENSADGRCQNCIRFNQQCLFHPVSSQAAFVPASAVYGPNARTPGADGRPGENGQYRNGEQPPMLYGAHGQPLGPAGPPQSPYSYAPPPPGYQQGYQYPAPYPPPHQAPPPAGQNGPHYEHQGQGAPADDRVSLKRPLPDDDPHNEGSHSSQSSHPNARARHSTYDSRANSRDSYGYPIDPTNLTPTSPRPRL